MTERAVAARKKKSRPEPASRGLTPAQIAGGTLPAKLASLQEEIQRDGGTVLRPYRDPLGGHWQILAALPLASVQPTPYQRDLSAPHVGRLAQRMEQLDRFLDPVIAYRAGAGDYRSPNGHHRLAALCELGARAVVALVVPDEEIAYKILALNTEKAHNVRERALEAIRMARALAELDPRAEREFALEFEDPTLLTLGVCYERRGRFSGGVYQPFLRRVERFLGTVLPRALAEREVRAARLLELDDAVNAKVAELKDRGFDSPYLKAYVVARINPLRFQRGGKPEFDETVDKMVGAARRLDPRKVRPEQVARAGGPPAGE